MVTIADGSDETFTGRVFGVSFGLVMVNSGSRYAYFQRNRNGVLSEVTLCPGRGDWRFVTERIPLTVVEPPSEES